LKGQGDRQEEESEMDRPHRDVAFHGIDLTALDRELPIAIAGLVAQKTLASSLGTARASSLLAQRSGVPV
jgi:hypothetical protein